MGKIYRYKSPLLVAICCGWGLTVKGYGIPFGDDERILTLYSGNGCITVHILITLWSANFMLFELYFNKAVTY